MKKKIIIGLAMVSALSFGAVNNNTNQQQMRYSNMNQTQMNNLTTTQQTELNKLMVERREAGYKKGLEMRTKQLEMEKLLAQDKVNWRSVEKLNKEIAEDQAKQRLEGLKFRKDIEDKYEITMGRSNMGNMGGKHNGNGMMGGNGNSSKNGRRNGNGNRN